MADPLETKPITINYAADAPNRYRAHRSPVGAFRAAWISLIVALIAGGLLLFASGRVFMIAGAVGLIASIAAFLCAGAASLENRTLSPQSPLRLQMSRCIQALVAAFVLAQLNGWNCAQTGDRIGQSERSHMTRTQLGGIAAASELYRQKYTTGPDGLDALLRSGLLTQKQLWFPSDPTPHQPGSPGFVPSCVFLTGAASANAPPSSILAYERGPWSTEGTSLFPRRFHSIVYSNGVTARLSPADLAAALSRQTQLAAP